MATLRTAVLLTVALQRAPAVQVTGGLEQRHGAARRRALPAVDLASLPLPLPLPRLPGWLAHPGELTLPELKASTGLMPEVLASLEQPVLEPVVGSNTSQSNSSWSPLRVFRGDNKTQAEITRVKLNAFGDGSALISSLTFNIVAVLLIAMLFTVLRRWNPAVYAREEDLFDMPAGQPQASAARRRFSTSASWLAQVRATTAEEEVREAGLDGWSLLEFYRLHQRIISCIGPPVMGFLLPAHYFAAKGLTPMDLLNRFDIGNIPDRSWLFWVHAALVWFIVLTVCVLVHWAYLDFLDRRFLWLQTIPAPQATTIMIENLPEELRSDRALAAYFSGPDGLFMRQSQIVQSAYIVRKTQEFQPKWQRLNEDKRALSLAMVAKERGRGSDDLKPLELSVAAQQEEVEAERQSIEQAVVDRNPQVCSAAGFVTFSSVLWQRLALKENFRADKTELVVSMPPDPTDVAYENLMANVVGSHTWEWLGWLCLLGLFIFWSPVVVFISSWTTLSAIRSYVPLAASALDSASRIFPFLPSLLEGVLATAALRLFLAFLPSLLFSIIRNFFPVKAGAYAQFRLGRWYFAFLIVFVLLVTTLGRSLVLTAVAVAQDPTGILDLFAQWLPRASHFYFNYIIFGWMTLAWEMVRIANLLRYWALSSAHGNQLQDAKRHSEPEDESSFGLGSRMGLAGLMSAITFVFCTCSPLMLCFAWVYFTIGRYSYGYLLVHAETKKPDLGGKFWVEAVNHIFFNVSLFVLLMTGVLCAHSGTFWCGPALVSVAASLPLYWTWARINAFEWETLPLEQLMKARRSCEGTPQYQKGVYRQPECMAV